MGTMPFSDGAPSAEGGDMGGGGGTWNGRGGSVPALCPYMLGLPVGVEVGENWTL